MLMENLAKQRNFNFQANLGFYKLVNNILYQLNHFYIWEVNCKSREGEVLVLLRGDWVESVLVLTLDNILDIYQDASRNIRIDQVDFVAVIRIRIRWIRKILASWIRIRIQGAKYQPKTEEKKFTLKTQVWAIEKSEIIKISWFLNGSLSLSIIISQKKDKKIRNFALLKKFSKF